MKLFKSVDEKLEDIGFNKIKEDRYGVSYERKNNEYNYTHRVDIGHKKSGKHLIQSYNPDLSDPARIGNVCVGLTGYETKLFLKKMKQVNLYSK